MQAVSAHEGGTAGRRSGSVRAALGGGMRAVRQEPTGTETDLFGSATARRADCADPVRPCQEATT